MSETRPVVIVGAGVAGLCCARELRQTGQSVLVLEASDQPGGRVRTDEVEGFRLDRGFQVLLEAYPAVREMLDVDALECGAFGSGAVLFDGQQTRLFADPLRHPAHAWKALTHPVGTLGDKLRLAWLRQKWAGWPIDRLMDLSEQSTRDYWTELGFSPPMQEGFLAPFFRGIFLGSEDEVSARMFRFIFAMFGKGRALLPAGGMQSITRQLADVLEPDTLRYGQTVARVEANRVELSTGERLEAEAVVVAVGNPEKVGLLSAHDGWRETTCAYFAAERPPVKGPWLALNGSGRGQVNQVAVPSQVASGYTPQGKELISVSINGIPDMEDPALADSVQQELSGWFGPQVTDWRFLKAYRIQQALPAFGTGQLPASGLRNHEGVWICGDAESHPSLQGAMASGLQAAHAVC